MKKTKKMLTLLLALVMVLAMSATAFAGTITIENGADGETYTAYKVFDVTYDGDGNYSYTISTSSAFYDWISTNGSAYGITLTKSAGDSETYVVSVDTSEYTSEGAWAKAFAEALAKAIENKDISVDGTEIEYGNGDGQSTSITVDSAGYYLIVSTKGTLVMLDTADDDVAIEEKNNSPSVEKTYNKDTDASASIGDTVTYTITITAEPGAENYVLHDVLSEGLTLDAESITVRVGDNALTSEEDYIVSCENEDGCDFEISFTDDYLSGIEEETCIVITYSATINEDAVIYDDDGDGNTNEAYLSYGSGSSTESSKVTTYVFDFDLEKTDGTYELSGAKFTLSDASGNVISFVKVTGEDNSVTYRVATEEEIGSGDVETTTEIEVGSATISGLGNGTYVLTEIEAPSGYNILTYSILVVIDDNGNVTYYADENDNETGDEGEEISSDDGDLEVENSSGTELPSTGGMGTTILYIAGIALVLIAGVALITKKRMAR